MFRNRIFYMISTSAMIVLMLSALFPLPALADGGGTSASAGATTPTTTARHAPSSASSLSQLPSGTKVVLLDGQGNKVALGSQDAAVILASGDPIWCPSTVVMPIAGLSGCSPAFLNGNLYTLTHAVQTGLWMPVVANSTIWILGGPDTSASEIVLNGLTLPFPLRTLANFTLTVNGGWTGVGSVLNPAVPSTFSGVGIKIDDWANSVALSNLSVQHAGVNGIEIADNYDHNISITLTNVAALNSRGDGALLNTCPGCALVPGPHGVGAITITNSAFDVGNILGGSNALWISTGGSINMTNVSVIGNLAHGASLHAVQNVTLSGANSFSANMGDGLDVVNGGTIASSGTLDASGNQFGQGVSLDNTAGTLPVTLNGNNTFDLDMAGGLDISSRGAVTVNNLDTHINGGNGATLNNTGAGSPLPVSLTGTSTFTNNTGNGLDISSHGAITINNVDSTGNVHYGVHLQNDYSPTTPSVVQVTGTNTFSDNYFGGLSVSSAGAVTLNNIVADGNGLGGPYDGLVVDNHTASTAQGLTLTGSNSFQGNSKNGAELSASGAVSLSNVTAQNNTGGSGVVIVNDPLGSLSPQSVTLLGTNALSGNHADNLTVQSFGAITINNLTASTSATGNGADLYAGSLDVTGKVTLNGVNNFDANAGSGLIVDSNDVVLANNLNAFSNGGAAGVSIDNTAGASAAVTLTGFNNFSGNTGGNGLTVRSKGVITLNNVTADSNHQTGADLANNGGLGGMLLKGTNVFYNNGADGVDLLSKGTISLTNIITDSNVYDGLYVSTSGALTVTCGDFTNNGTSGFYGYGLEATAAVPAIVMTGTLTTGNFSGPYTTHSAVVPTFAAKVCALP